MKNFFETVSIIEELHASYDKKRKIHLCEKKNQLHF